MARYHGISADTFNQILIDSGAIYYNYTDIDNPGTLLGATRGGAVFTRKPTYVDLPYEGVSCSVVGQKHLVGYEVTLEVSIITINDINILKAIPNASGSEVTGYTTITEGEWDASAVHGLTNIALIGERLNGGDPIIIKMSNPLCLSDFALPFADKSEVVSKWVFTAFCSESQVAAGEGTWSIEAPNDVSELGVAIAALDTSASYLYSANGISWSVGTLPYSKTWYTLIFGGGKVVLISNNDDEAAWSVDGVAWTGYAMPTTQVFYAGAYGGGVFAIVGRSSYCAYSADGITWTPVSAPASASWAAMEYGNGLFVMIAYNSASIGYSADGITWSSATFSAAKYWMGLAFGDGVFVAVNYTNAIGQQVAWSADGINWTWAVTGAIRYYWSCIAYGNGIFVILTSQATQAVVGYSTDAGQTWTIGALTTGRWFTSVVYVDGIFTAFVYNSNVIAYSADGINWVESTVPATVKVLSAKYG